MFFPACNFPFLKEFLVKNPPALIKTKIIEIQNNKGYNLYVNYNYIIG